MHHLGWEELGAIALGYAGLRNPEGCGGLAIPPRRITVSTSDLMSGIETLAKPKIRPHLALSHNATTDGYRSKIMLNRV